MVVSGRPANWRRFCSDQLCFDLDESDRFLNGALDLGLDSRSLQTLEERTEGWPAGLYLAALTMRTRTDRAAFVSDFAGSSRHVVDYLSSEVLDGLSADDRTFLSATSILSRFSGPLCDAVSGMEGSAARLRDLERANLFIVRLDEQGTWFRFHRLFAELLRSQLAEASPGLEPELHRRAAAWLAEHGPTEAAVEHALAAGQRAWAASLIVRSWNEFTRAGEFQTLERLIAMVGDAGEMAGALAIVEGLSAGLLGAGPTVCRRLKAKAERLGWAEPAPDGTSIAGLAALLVAAWFADDLAEQQTAAEYLTLRYPEEVGLLAGGGRVALGLVLMLEGDASGALAILPPIERLAGTPSLEITGAATRSLATSDLGSAGEAERIARASLASAERWGLSTSRAGGLLWLALGSALAAQGKPHEALPHLERALVSWGVPGTLHRAHVLIELTSTYSAVGETAKARAAAREAGRIIDACPNAGSLPARLEVVDGRIRARRERAIPVGDRPSKAEMRVLRLLATPLSTREIGDQLFLSINTVKSHVKALHQKFGTSTREATVARARELGLL